MNKLYKWSLRCEIHSENAELETTNSVVAACCAAATFHFCIPAIGEKSIHSPVRVGGTKGRVQTSGDCCIFDIKVGQSG